MEAGQVIPLDRERPRIVPAAAARRAVDENTIARVVCSDVVGRDAELASIRAFFDRLPAGSAALLIEGQSGIGKTTRWQAEAVTERQDLDGTLAGTGTITLAGTKHTD